MHQMTHIENDKGKIDLSVGVCNSSIELEIKIQKENGKEKIVLNFPEK